MLRIVWSAVNVTEVFAVFIVFFFSLDKLTLSPRKLSTVWQWAWVIEQTPGTKGMKAYIMMWLQSLWKSKGTAVHSSQELWIPFTVWPGTSCLFWVCLRCGFGIRIPTYPWCCYNLRDCECSIFCLELVKGWLLWFSANKYAHFVMEVLCVLCPGHLASLGLSHTLVAWP